MMNTFFAVFEKIADKYLIEILAALVILAIAWPLKWLWRKFRAYVNSDCCSRLEQARYAMRESGKGPWLEVLVSKTPKYDSPAVMPVIMIANLKGGVGKTTLAANLGASLSALNGAGTHDMRSVLVIDYDFQGSLSSMALLDETREFGSISMASTLLTGQKRTWRMVNTEGLNNNHRLWATPSFYDLADHETRMLVEWLIGDIKTDIRYGLFEQLNLPEVRNKFRFVIIDAPPRITTAAVQAFCASTHILIPTVLDGLSGEAVGTFLTQIKRHREKICPELNVIGVVGNLFNEQATNVNNGAIETIKRAIEEQGFPERTWMGLDVSIPRNGKLTEAAGERIAYFGGNDANMSGLRKRFDLLRDEILRRL